MEKYIMLIDTASKIIFFNPECKFYEDDYYECSSRFYQDNQGIRQSVLIPMTIMIPISLGTRIINAETASRDIFSQDDLG